MSRNVILENKSLDDLIDIVYPVGSVYISVTSTNPQVLFGGKWTQIKDTFLLACGNSYANGATGGEANHTLTIDEMPSHDHGASIRVHGYSGWDTYTTPNYSVNIDYASNNYHAPNITLHSTTVGTDTTTGIAGGSQPHNNMPPYLAVYMWKRIS